MYITIFVKLETFFSIFISASMEFVYITPDIYSFCIVLILRGCVIEFLIFTNTSIEVSYQNSYFSVVSQKC